MRVINGKLQHERLAALIGALLVHALLAYAFLMGLAVHMPTRREEILKIFKVTPPLPSPPVEERHKPQSRAATQREGAAAPRNIRSRATEIVAPPAQIIIMPPPIVAAPIAGTGDERSSGASPLPGPGTGAGGEGAGTGSGRYRDGPGGGGGIGPRQIKGRIRSSDYPRPAVEAGAGGMVGVRYTVAIDGRVTRCMITHSSGNADLDNTTCRLIQERFRFDPARDTYGRPVQADIVEDHEWILEHVIEDNRR